MQLYSSVEGSGQGDIAARCDVDLLKDEMLEHDLTKRLLLEHL